MVSKYFKISAFKADFLKNQKRFEEKVLAAIKNFSERGREKRKGNDYKYRKEEAKDLNKQDKRGSVLFPSLL